MLERLADEAARVLGIDRAEIRRRNLVPVEAMPYKTPIGPTYDCGNFPKVFSRLLEIADYKGFAQAAGRGRAHAQAPRLRHRLLCGILGRCAVADGGGARRPRRLLRGGANPRAAGRQRAGAARHPQSRPGPRHHLRPDHLVAARRADGERRDHRGRHRSGAVRLGHVRLALHRGRRLGARPRRDEGHRERQEDRRASARGIRRRHRLRRGIVHRRRHRPARDAARGRARRPSPDQLSGRPGARPAGQRGLRSAATSPGATARTPASSRSIATPAKSISSATGAWTTSAPSSIR